MPSNGNASSASKDSKAEENFYLRECKKNKKVGWAMCLLSLALARAAVLKRSIKIQTLIWIGTKRSKTTLSQTLKLQASKTRFKLRTRLCLANDGPRY
jgi:hypothetical protein